MILAAYPDTNQTEPKLTTEVRKIMSNNAASVASSTKPTSKNNDSSNIKFRIVFVSPFFCLEVKSGMGHWQTVYSQIGTPSDSVAQINKYPMICFKSFQSALNYAKNDLGLTSLYKGSFLNLFDAPPAYLMRQGKGGSDSSSTLMSTNTEIM